MDGVYGYSRETCAPAEHLAYLILVVHVVVVFVWRTLAIRASATDITVYRDGERINRKCRKENYLYTKNITIYYKKIKEKN